VICRRIDVSSDYILCCLSISIECLSVRIVTIVTECRKIICQGSMSVCFVMLVKLCRVSCIGRYTVIGNGDVGIIQ
jgi:hypothetical protein